jgi:sulfotransferase family protein
MQNKINKPIFVVGSPRSGTSILTWCLGQHPNMFPVPESNWMGDFAISVAIGHQIGAARGDRSILSAMDIRADELFAAFGQSINDLILSHRRDLERKRKATHSPSEPKMRWVDGTPEYSLHICALRKLFPEALFVHVLRDVRDVVRSMLNFNRVAGFRLVRNEEQAYKYWLRMVKACVQAERAYGSSLVHRFPYTVLIDDQERAIRSLLDFVGEPYCAKCLEPLNRRINSSNVPPDFVADDPSTDPNVAREASDLYAKLKEDPEWTEGSSAVADEIEAAFADRVQHIATVEKQLHKAVQEIRLLEKQNCRQSGAK